MALEYTEPALVDPKATLAPLPKADTYLDPAKATVEGRVTNLMSAPNELLQQAKALSNEDYQSRGLMLSGGGVQAGTGAMMGKALEIATPDAALYGNMALNTQRSTEDAALNNQLAQIEKAKSQNNARISGQLTELEQKGQQELQKLSDTAQMQRLDVDNQWKQSINFDQLDAEEAKALMGVAATLGAELTGGIERILRDPNITNKTSATNALMTQYRTQLSTAAAIVGIKLKWS
jgi:hypothetical protein